MLRQNFRILSLAIAVQSGFSLIHSSIVLAAQIKSPAKTQDDAYVAMKATNGMDVVAVPMPKVPLVTIVLVAKAGAMTEIQKNNGLTHLWEHMFFKGNQSLPDQEAFNKRVRQLGITFNGDTSEEMVRYYFTLPSRNLDAGLKFMADAISTPLLEPKELERERKVVLDEYDRAASQPGFDLNNMERMIIYGDKEYLRNALGRRSIIETATREQLLDIKHDVFIPANCALIVSGDVESAPLLTMVHKHFAGWTTPKDWKPVDRGSFPEFPATTDIVRTTPLTQNVNMRWTWKGPRVQIETSDTWVVDILSNLLEHRSGKFFNKYIDSGMTLNSGFSYYTQSKTGELVLYAMTTAENAAATKAALLNEPNEWLKPDYFNKTQLDDVRRKLKISYKMELNKPSAFGKKLAFWWAITGLSYYHDYIPSMEKITLSDIQQFVKKYLINKPYVATTLLNPKDAAVAKMKDNSAPYAEKYLKNY